MKINYWKSEWRPSEQSLSRHEEHKAVNSEQPKTPSSHDVCVGPTLHLANGMTWPMTKQQTKPGHRFEGLDITIMLVSITGGLKVHYETKYI